MDSWLANLRTFTAATPAWAATAAGLALLAVFAVASSLLAKHRLLRGLRLLTRSTSYDWDDALTDAGFFTRLAQVVPALIVYFGLGAVPGLAEPVVRSRRTG